MIDPTTQIPDPLGLGAEAVAFIETLILPDGKPFRLVPEQKQIVRKLFGDVDEDGLRPVEVCYLGLPTGNAKSTLAAAIALLMLAHPKFRIPNGQIIIAAPTRKTARDTSFSIVEGFIERMFPDEAERALRFRIISNHQAQEIHHLPSGSSLKVLSRQPNAQEGLAVYLLLAEESHVWAEQSNRLWAVLRKSQSKIVATTPLALICTTAGAGAGGIGWELHKQAREIAEGKETDPAWLPILYEADPTKEDWRDPDVWKRVNFGIPAFKSMRTLRNLAREADRSATARSEFWRYQLNYWMSGVSDPWLESTIYDSEIAAAPFDIEDVKHLPCFIGVDAGQTDDLTAVCAVFHDEDQKLFYCVPHIWCPAESIKRRSDADSVPYIDWQETGHIIGTDGNSIDEDVIEAKIRELYRDYDVRGIGFDPYGVKRMMSRLNDDGLPVIQVPQNYRFMSPAMKNCERAILDGRLRHGGHPALRWSFLNVPLPVPTPDGNIKPSKKDRKRKIDPAVAVMVALVLCTVLDPEVIYDFEALTGRPDEEANG